MKPADSPLIAIVPDDAFIGRSLQPEGAAVAPAASGSCGREAGASPRAARPGPPADVPRAGRSGAGIDDGLRAFLGVRNRLFGIACRMLGSAVDAEDVVQDAWIRWQTADRSLVRSAAAFLTTTATRLAINVKQSAHSRRERCAGPGLPEPVDTNPDPPTRAERYQALAWGMQLLLETLAPTERAAYILREAFDYSYRDIAKVLRLEEANARQVVNRARQHVARGRKTPADSTEHRRLLDAFTAATHDGDVASLEGLLASGVV